MKYEAAAGAVRTSVTLVGQDIGNTGLLGPCPLGRSFAHPLHGVEHHLGRVFQLKLLFDSIAEGIDGSNRHFEIVGNLASALALA